MKKQNILYRHKKCGKNLIVKTNAVSPGHGIVRANILWCPTCNRQVALNESERIE